MRQAIQPFCSGYRKDLMTITSVNGRKANLELFKAALQRKPVLAGIIKEKDAKKIRLTPQQKLNRYLGS
jgi:hypothetical protein